METIQETYNRLVLQPSDINEHLPTLRRYARECGTVGELGVRGVVSTWALLYGLAESRHRPRALYSVDIEPAPGIEAASAAAERIGIEHRFFREDSATVCLPEDVDCLFIDTWHVYAHLRRELAHHHWFVRRYIILHDTEVDARLGETVRLKADAHAQSVASDPG